MQTNHYTDAIQKRKSVRSFTPTGLQRPEIDKIQQLLTSVQKNPFPGQISFKLITNNPVQNDTLKKLGTYGVIKNCFNYIIAITTPTQNNLVNLGFSLEKIILDLTQMNYGTCWLGGTFDKSAFSKQVKLENDEFIPVIIALGHSSLKPTLVDRFIRFSAKSKNRKPWNEIFFNGNPSSPMEVINDQDLSNALEMTRLAPSASNKQPWRIIFDEQKKQIHFTLKRAKPYKQVLSTLKLADLPLVDMGIAMSHFQLTMNHFNRTGSWERYDLSFLNHEYIATFQEAL